MTVAELETETTALRLWGPPPAYQAAQMIIHAQGSEFNTKCAIVLNRLAWPTATNNSFAGLAAAADLLCGHTGGLVNFR